MSTNFPTSLDSLTNPLSTDTMVAVSHSSQHANVNDAIEALETKVGIDNSAVTTSLDYKLKSTSSVSPGHKHNATDIADGSVSNTEFQYLGSVTSDIQTQLDSKATDSFKTISVSGQSDVVADSKTDTLTLVAGTNVTITTNAGTDTITISGTGDVVGPGSSTDNAVARFDTTTGKLIQNSGVTIDDTDNIYVNNYFAGVTSTVSAAGTTVLTIASDRTQTLTGSSTQNFQLPDATTLPLASVFEFNNNSSSSLIIKNAGSTTLYTIPAGGSVSVALITNSTANGSWDFHALAPVSVTWGSGVTGLVMNSVLTTSPSVGSGASSSTAPSFIPQRGANTTGFGGDGTNLYATIAGTSAMTIAAAGITVPKVTTTGDIELGNASDTTLSRVSAGKIAVEGVNVGTEGILQNSQSAAYTTVLTDAGKHIYHPSADTTARTWTIDSNANVAYPIGTAITFINDTSAGTITIAITSDTLVLAGAGTTGSRTLAANGIATAVKMTSTRWMISGTGLT